jgi:hypothetical protein
MDYHGGGPLCNHYVESDFSKDFLRSRFGKEGELFIRGHADSLEPSGLAGHDYRAIATYRANAETQTGAVAYPAIAPFGVELIPREPDRRHRCSLRSVPATPVIARVILQPREDLALHHVPRVVLIVPTLVVANGGHDEQSLRSTRVGHRTTGEEPRIAWSGGTVLCVLAEVVRSPVLSVVTKC